MIRETIVPSIPDIRNDNILEALRAIKSTLDVREGSIGDPLDQLVTLRELASLNVVDTTGTTTTPSGARLPVGAVLPPPVSGYNPATDYTPPPQPTNLRAKGGFTNVFLEWDGAPYRNHGYAEIWRSQTDVLGNAVMVGTTAASVYADPAQEDTTYYYWVRFVSKAAVTGPYNLTSGTPATTAINIGNALTALSNEITSSPLFIDLGSRIRRIETDDYIRNLTSGAYKYSLDRLTASIDTASSDITYVRGVTATQATQLNTLSSTVSGRAKVFFQASAPTDTTANPLKANDLWYDTDDNNKSYRWSGTAWVVFVTAGKTYYQATAPVSSTAAPLFEGDLWYDSDDQNKAYRWSGTVWEAIRDQYIDARVTTLEQTKIGYATFIAAYNHNGVAYAAGNVFDNGGAIIDKATTDAWNVTHPVSGKLTWNIGLPLASAVKQVQITDGSDNLTLEQRFTAQKTTNGNLLGQYSVKIDNNGHVSGFGLSSQPVNGTVTSSFIVRADRFALAGPNDTNNPLGTTVPTTASTPFMVFAAPTPVTLNGVTKTYPAGVWMNSAFIANATIDTAQIRDLTADKITTGNLTAAIGISTGKIYGGVAVNSVSGNLTQTFAGAAFGTGFFLGLDSSTYKFYVGSPDKNMNWDGANLTVTGTINATSGSFRNITVYNAQDQVILSSGGIPYGLLTGTKPPTDATRNATGSGLLSARPTGADGDFYYATDTYTLYQKVAGAWVAAGTYGAPAGTLVNGVPVASVTTAVTNFNNGNNRLATAINGPWVNTDGSAVDHTVQTDGSVDISFEWNWAIDWDESTIDGFQIFVRQSASATPYTIGTTPADETVYEIPAAKRAFILFGTAADKYYTFGVRAYRSVDKDINATGVIVSYMAQPTAASENPYQPSVSVAFGGNVTGTVNGVAAGNVNVWTAISGTGKPESGATKNNVYRQATAPTSGMGVNDVWFNTTTSAVYYYSGTSWVLAGDVTANNTAAGFVGQGPFAKLVQINAQNISTYIAGAAISNAYIDNLDAVKITAGTIAADRLSSTIVSAKVANLQTAQIGNAQITTAKIKNYAVSILVGDSSSGEESVVTIVNGTPALGYADASVMDLIVVGTVNFLGPSGYGFDTGRGDVKMQTYGIQNANGIEIGLSAFSVGRGENGSGVCVTTTNAIEGWGGGTYVFRTRSETTSGPTRPLGATSLMVFVAYRNS